MTSPLKTLVAEARHAELAQFDPTSTSDPEDLLWAAIGLRQLGWIDSSPQAGSPTSLQVLDRLDQVAPSARWRHHSLVERVRGEFEAEQSDREGLLSKLRAIPRDPPVLRGWARLTQGLVEVRESEFLSAENCLLEALDVARDGHHSILEVEAWLGLARIRVWQGLVDPAEEMLSRASAGWKGNRLFQADVDYERAILFTDRRLFAEAVGLLEAVVASQEKRSAGEVKLARSRNAYVNALIANGELDEAEAQLAKDADRESALPPYRQVIRIRHRAAIALAHDRHEEAAEYVKAARERAGAGRYRFRHLALDIVQGRIEARRPGATGDERERAAERLIRAAAAFSTSTHERPHEIRARLYAIEAYVAAVGDDLESWQGDRRYRLAVEQAERLARAAGAISLRLADPEALDIVKRLVAMADRFTELHGAASEVDNDARRTVRLLVRGAPERTLVNGLSMVDDADTLEVMARVCDILADWHRVNHGPLGFTAHQLTLVEPLQPVLELPERALMPLNDIDLDALDDPDFVAPERANGELGTLSTDLYVVGAMLMARFFGMRPPSTGSWIRRTVSRGRWLWRWLWVPRRTPWQRRLVRLVYDLTTPRVQERPHSAERVADELRAIADLRTVMPTR